MTDEIFNLKPISSRRMVLVDVDLWEEIKLFLEILDLEEDTTADDMRRLLQEKLNDR